MSETVGVGQLRQNLSRYLRRLEHGERFVVTDRNRPVGILAPLPEHEDRYERLVSEGVIIPGNRRRARLQPIELEDSGRPLSEIIIDMRDEEEPG